MANNTVNILIKKGTSGISKAQEQVSPVESEENDKINENDKNQEMSKFAVKALGVSLVNSGKQIGQYAISQFGNITGNTIAQANINAALDVVNYAMSIAVGGWVGVAATAISFGTKAFESYINTQKANAQAEFIKQRSGNIVLNGSRGTDN